MTFLPFLEPIITFPDGTKYQRLEPITDFRQCHDSIPSESRILYKCLRLSPSSLATNQPDDNDIYILKIKVQIPGPSNDTNISEPSQPPIQSDGTTHELSALTTFRDTHSPYSPHLTAFTTFPQKETGILPGGYISCTVMSKIPGESLFDLGYWSLAPEERREIQKAFLEALAAVRRIGIEPGDKGLRNVMWDRETRRCGLVDFELWDPFDGEAEVDGTAELQKWGLAHKPPAKNWWAEFGIDTC